MSVSSATREPDLFFPASDSEEEDEVTPAQLPSSTTLKASSSSSTTLKRNGGGSSPNLNGSSLNHGEATLLGSQGSDIIPLDSTPNLTVPSTAGPSRIKRKSPTRSPSEYIPPSFTSGYLGEFVCEGWSLSKGKGYCVPGSKVIFERPKAAREKDGDAIALPRSREKMGPAKLVNGKVVNAKTKIVGGKQVTLGAFALGKKAPSAVCPGRLAGCGLRD